MKRAAKEPDPPDQRLAHELHFIEEAGLLLEQSGIPRMAGRILGWLLICDPPYQSLGQLADVVQGSKGSLSTMTRLLIRMGIVERIGLPGHRRDYFRIKSGAWTKLYLQAMREISGARHLAEHGLELVKGMPPELQERLLEVRDLYSFVEREYPAIVARWEKERRSASH